MIIYKLLVTDECQGAASSTAPLPVRPSRISPLIYNPKSRIHQTIFEDARELLIRSSLCTCPFMTETERKSAAQEALLSAAKEQDEGKLHYLRFLNVSEASTRVRESVERRESYCVLQIVHSTPIRGAHVNIQEDRSPIGRTRVLSSLANLVG
jgi:hypothetical protein